MSQTEEARVLPFKTKDTPASSDTKFWIVSSGKGGIGRTFITGSLGITLARMGETVLLVDLDVNGANLHSSLGVVPSRRNVSMFFSGEVADPLELVTETSFPKLSLLEGFCSPWIQSDMQIATVMRLCELLQNSKYDYVIFDIGPGLHSFHPALMQVCHERFVVSSPEPVSIERTYRFFELYFQYCLNSGEERADWKEISASLSQEKYFNREDPFAFKTMFNVFPTESFEAFQALARPENLHIVMNSTRSHADQDLGLSLKSVCQKYFNVPIHYAGWIDYDNAVWQAARKRQPTLVEFPYVPLVGQFVSVCKNVVQPQILSQLSRAVV
jgi:flagellar biosynthesis protein FlhG